MRHAAVTADARTKIPDARGSKVSYVSSIITVTGALSPRVRASYNRCNINKPRLACAKNGS